MQIHALSSLAPGGAENITAIRAWKAGQVLLAEVIGQPEKNYTRLRIGGHLIDARTELPLKAGQTLNVKVALTGNGVTLRVLTSAHPAAIGSIERGLARTLPRQGGLDETLDLMRTVQRFVSQTEAPAAGSKNEALRTALEGLVRSLPSSRELAAPRGLHAAIIDAATPTEQKLAAAGNDPKTRTSTALASDLRTHLSRIGAEIGRQSTPGYTPVGRFPISVIQGHTPALGTPFASVHAPRAIASQPPDPAPVTLDRVRAPDIQEPTVRDLVDRALSRVLTQQLSNLHNAPLPSGPLVVELPVRHLDRVDVWHFQFTEEQNRTAQPSPGTSVVVQLKLQLGPQRTVSAELRANGDRLSVRIGSDDTALNELISTRIGELESSLAHDGGAVSAIADGRFTFGSDPQLAQKRLVDDSI